MSPQSDPCASEPPPASCLLVARQTRARRPQKPWQPAPTQQNSGSFQTLLMFLITQPGDSPGTFSRPRERHVAAQFAFGVHERLDPRHHEFLVALLGAQEFRQARNTLVFGNRIERLWHHEISILQGRDAPDVGNARLIAEPVSRCQKNKRENQSNDDVVLPTRAWILPENEALQHR